MLDVSSLEAFGISTGSTTFESVLYESLIAIFDKFEIIKSSSSSKFNIKRTITGTIKIPDAYNTLDNSTLTVGGGSSADQNIQSITVCEGWSQNIKTIASSLRGDKLRDLFENLADVRELGGRTIDLNGPAINNIPAEDLEIATNKGWTVS